MKCFAICDNIDAKMGMRLAGMTCAVAEGREDFDQLFDRALEDKDIGILVLTEKALAMNPEKVFEARRLRKMPLMVTLPGSIGQQPVGQELLAYISEAVGVKLY